MSGLSMFFAENVQKEELVEVVVSKRFKDADGNPTPWKLACITSDEDEAIRKSCTKKVPVVGKKGVYAPETDFDSYLGKLAAKCVVFPNLNDAALQDSYKVMGADKVLKVMLKPGEYQDLLKKVQEINGFDTILEEDVQEVKNS